MSIEYKIEQLRKWLNIWILYKVDNTLIKNMVMDIYNETGNLLYNKEGMYHDIIPFKKYMQLQQLIENQSKNE